MTRDVVVLGAGPAGTALATALDRRGLATALVDPAPARPWPNRYGAWTDELEALGLGQAARRTWPRSELVLPDGTVLELARGYASIDGVRLREALHTSPGVQVLPDRAVGVEHHAAGSDVRLATGPTLTARLVIDATGHRSPFVTREGQAPTAWQIAYGEVQIDVSCPYPTDAMRFMDWRDAGTVDADPRPTFLYAMPEGEEGGWFFEETQLIGTPGMSQDQLERRLRARLSRDGVTGTFAGGVERCCFPMDPPLPRLDQRTLGFGAAASLVHPATGYLLTRTLRLVEPLADALADALDQGRPPGTVARDAWRVIWPSSQVEAARLLQFGARTLLAMNREQIGRFYQSFFSIGDSGWRAYLAGDLPAAEVARVMLDVYGAADWSTRWRLTRQGLGDPLPLLKGVLASR